MAKGKNKKSGFIVKFIAVIITLVILVVCICLTGFASRNQTTNKWFGNGDVHSWTLANTAAKDDDDGSGDVDGEEQPNNNGLSIATFALAAEDYAAYGISEQSIKAGVLNARYTPDNTSNKRTNWTWRWSGKNSWSNDKVLSDYVTFTPGNNEAPNCTYAVKQSFGDTIIVECNSVAKPELKAATRIEYLARYDSIDYDSDLYFNCNTPTNIFEMLEASDDVYTCVPTSYSANLTFKLGSDFAKVTKFTNYVENDIHIENVTASLILYDDILSGDDEFLEDYVKYYLNNNNSCIYTLYSTITCYYNDVEYYTFTSINDIYLDDESIKVLSVDPQKVTIPNGVIVC